MAEFKFCGLTRPVDAEVAASLGASHIGVIFAESRRRVTPAAARDILYAGGAAVRRVGVFGRSPAHEIATVAHDLRLDVVQLHAVRMSAELAAIRRIFEGRLWAVVPVAPGEKLLPTGWRRSTEGADAVMLDAAFAGAAGGTGRPIRWDAMRRALATSGPVVPLVLAGGLNPHNVREAISWLTPAIVDVSSGVESAPGVKDHGLMNAFAEAVRSAS